MGGRNLRHQSDLIFDLILRRLNDMQIRYQLIYRLFQFYRFVRNMKDIPFQKFTFLFKIKLFPNSSILSMANCASKTKPDGTKKKGHGIEQDSEIQSTFHITVKRKTGIFTDIGCPILNQRIEEVEKELEQKDLNSCFLGLRGEFDPLWKKVRIKELGKELWYVGEWSGGIMNGNGNIYNQQSDYLIKGMFVQGVLSKNKCIKIFSNGSYYIGSLNHSLDPDGQGELHHCNGIYKYCGQFVGGVPHGNGKQIDGSTQFEGVFVNGEKKSGTLITQKGIYEGEFENNAKEGKGRFMWKNGNIFEGYFSHNKMIEAQPSRKKSKKVTFTITDF